MSNFNLNIVNLFAEIFGVSSPLFIPWGRQRPAYIPSDHKDITLGAKEEAERVSWMGTPVLDSFTLDGGTYKTYDKDGNLLSQTTKTFDEEGKLLTEETN